MAYDDGMTELPRDPNIQDLVGATEAAAILGVSRQTVVLRAAAGSLLGLRLSDKAWVFRRVVVERERDQAKFRALIADATDSASHDSAASLAKASGVTDAMIERWRKGK